MIIVVEQRHLCSTLCRSQLMTASPVDLVAAESYLALLVGTS
jgi:hypothetical protein